MAENKKSFIAYSDWYEMFKALPDDVAGKLIKHIFSYVNDENPSTDDYIINALFAQVKSTLKRDLLKWEDQRLQRSEAGKKSAEIRSTKFNDRSTTVNETERNSTVSVSVSVNDNVNDNVIIKENEKKPIKIDLHTRKQNFITELSLFKGKYTSDLLNAFFNYWTELNQPKTKMRFELEKTFEVSKRLSTWSKKEYGTIKQSNPKNQGASLNEIAAIANKHFGHLPD